MSTNGEKKGKKEVENLPPNTDSFWDNADKEVIKLTKAKSCKHYFLRISGIEVECQNCHAGFQISLGYQVKNGHIYLHGSLVI